MSVPINPPGSDNGYYLTHELSVQNGVVVVESSPQPGLEDAAVSWDEAVRAYLGSALDSEHTRRAYSRHLRNAREVLDVESVAQVNGAKLAKYRSLMMASELSPASQAQGLSALRSFLQWVADLGGDGPSGQVIKVALRTPRGSRTPRYTVLTEQQIAAMFGAARSCRDRALLAVMVGGGLRVGECAKLEVGDLVEGHDGGFTLHVRAGKGAKDRLVPVGADVAGFLVEYLTDSGRHLGAEGALFQASDRGAASRSRRGLSSRAMARIVRELSQGAGIAAKKISPHSMRHTFATRALRSGGNVVAVARLLGHSSIATTQRYVDHLALSELRATVPALPLESGPGDTSNGARGQGMTPE